MYPTMLTGKETVISYADESIMYTNASSESDAAPG